MIREIYYNINKKVYSIRAKSTPVSYARLVRVYRPTFVVRTGGRAAVLRDKQKNVHAFVKGEMETLNVKPPIDGLKKIRYDPYQYGYFYDVHTHEPIHEAEYAILILDENNKPHVYVKECE